MKNSISKDSISKDPVSNSVPIVAALLLPASLLINACTQTGGSSPFGMRTRPVDFQEDIRPLFQTKCLECHNSRIAHGRLNLETRELAFRPRPGGPVIVPGHPEKSSIYTALQLSDDERTAMPPTPHRLSERDVQALHDWIAAGADWPPGEDGRLYPPAEKYPYPPVSHPAIKG